MGEWSDYFEDFPEENSANYVGSTFDPERAAKLREQDAKFAEAKRLHAEKQSNSKLQKPPKTGGFGYGGTP